MSVLLLLYVAFLKGTEPKCLIRQWYRPTCPVNSFVFSHLRVRPAAADYICTPLEFMRTSAFEKTVEGKGTFSAAKEESLNASFTEAFHRDLSTNTSFQHLCETTLKESDALVWEELPCL